MLVLCYPKCGTCRKALAWLAERGAVYESRNIAVENPTREELSAWHQASGLPLKRFFNTSGLVYKEMGLAARLPQMTEEEMLDLLSSNGMLVRRPILVTDDRVLVGFKEAEWESLF